MMTRRDFMKAAGLLALWPYGCARQTSAPAGAVVNDVHSQLNPTKVDRVGHADARGRGSLLNPFGGDVESFGFGDADGNVRTCSRQENQQLFSLVIGGYGLFGIVGAVTLRPAARGKLGRGGPGIEGE